MGKNFFKRLLILDSLLLCCNIVLLFDNRHSFYKAFPCKEKLLIQLQLFMHNILCMQIHKVGTIRAKDVTVDNSTSFCDLRITKPCSS